jgi:hypothetical protein
MSIFILENYVYCEETAERIDINSLNKGLSNHYGKDINITNKNLKKFTQDIEKFCFNLDEN